MTQQGLRQASARTQSAFATETNYNEDLLRLFDAQSIPAGTFNERQLRWINVRMAASYTNLNDAMQAYATGQGAFNWSSMGALENTANFALAMPFGDTYTRTGSATALSSAGVLESFAADEPQRTGRGLALEPARTNFGVPSNLPEATTGTTVTPAAAVSPDGTVNATRTTKTDATVTRYVRTRTLMTVSVSTVYTVSEYFKYDGFDTTVSLEFNNGDNWGVGWRATFTVAASGVTVGTVSDCTAAVLDVGDGWYLCSATFTTAGAVPTPANPDVLGQINGGSGVTVLQYGFQVEVGAFATSYVPTTASAVTRSLPVFTEPVPTGRTKALLTYADATTTLVTGLTPGGTFDVVTPVLAANKGRFGASELVSRVWQP